MTLYPAVYVDLSLNLQPLLTYLKQRKVGCHVTEEKGQQCLWISAQELVPQVQQLVEGWKRHGFRDSFWREVGVEHDVQETAHAHEPWQDQSSWGVLFQAVSLLQRYPVTLLVIVLGFLGALLVSFDKTLVHVSWLTMQPIQLNGDRLLLASMMQGLEWGQWWRPLTPIFLHFGVMHIIFNALWVWELGRRLETIAGHFGLLAFIVVTGVASNLAQYWWGGPSLFGGLSGVVYALVGFLMVWQRFRPLAKPVPEGIFIFMLVWQVLCMSGAVDFFISGSVANGAHLGGLLVGIALVFIGLKLSPPKQG